MGLKFSDTLRLSWSNIAQHKKRSVVIILTISILFGVIMGFNFLTFGVEKTMLSASAGQTGGDVYLEAWYGRSMGTWYDYVKDPEEIAQVDLTPVINEEADQKIRKRVTEYGGEVIGYYWYYQLDYPYRVIDKSVVEKFIDTDLWESLPEGKMPTIMPEGWEPPTYAYGGESDTRLRDRLGDSLYRVGTISSTEEGKPTLDGFNPLNVILAQLAGATNDDFWLVDDGSGKVEAFMRDQLKKYLAEEDSLYSLEPTKKTVVAKFSDPYQAVAYASPDEEALGVKVYSSDYQYGTQDLFGTTLMVADSFNTQRALLIAVEVLLLVVAVSTSLALTGCGGGRLIR
jgi:hypothetical protein